MSFYKLTLLSLDACNEEYKVNFDNVEIKYIKTIINENTLFFLSNIAGVLIMKNAIFYYNLAGYLINIIQVANNATLANIIFYQNVVNMQVLNLEQIYFATLKNLSCINNNIEENQKKGGCFRSKDSSTRVIDEVSIINCFSSQKTVGLIIIDAKVTKVIKRMDDTSNNLLYVIIIIINLFKSFCSRISQIADLPIIVYFMLMPAKQDAQFISILLLI